VQKATISQLKNRLSAYLKKVRAGQTILVLDRDEPVARLERVEAGGTTDDRLTRLERAGLVRRGGGNVDVPALRGPAPRSSASIVDGLLEERREGR
jgi:prevent-host-death family protein